MNHGEVNWDDAGPRGAPALLTLHSLGWSARMWAPQVDVWAQDRRVIGVNLPGHGSTTAWPRPFGMKALAASVVGVLDREGIEHFDVCGLSLGGQVALQIAADHPGRVRRLVACATAAQVGREADWNARIARVTEAGMEGVVDQIVERFFSEDFRNGSPDEVAEARAAVLAADPEGYVGCCESLRDTDLSPALARIRAPTLLLAGSRDVSTPESVMRGLARGIADSRLEVISGVGHILNREAPDRVRRLVMGHLGEP